MRWTFLLAAIATLVALHTRNASAQGAQFVPGYPLYCKGPLTTGAPVVSTAGQETSTPFKWAAAGAGVASPGAGQCVWADRAASGSEILLGGGNVVCDFSGAMKSVPAGAFIEIGVARDPLVNNCMHLTRYLGTVSPPFSAVPALPPFTRQSIASLTPAQITSLRHGIQVMKSRAASVPTSYRFQANIHGTTDPATTPAEMQDWNQCEHGSFYFLSWHRMYLYFFDRILRAASGDPTLALPYWNWTDPAQRTLPAAFRSPAATSNPLYVAPPGRPAPLDAGTASLGPGTVAFTTAFAATNFDSSSGSGASFGGQIASATQFNSPHGDLESQPHDVVHVALAGLMGDPDTAAQDPIFWLHHNNIDRMWKRWLQQGGGRADPADAAWRDTHFTFYDEAGHAVYLTGSQIVDTVGQLNYRFDDDPPWIAPKKQQALIAQNQQPAPAIPVAAAPAAAFRMLATSALNSGGNRITLSGNEARVTLPLPEAMVSQLQSRVLTAATPPLVLRLDDIQYEKSNGTYYEVYVNPPPGQPLDTNSPGYVANLGLFGLKPHAMAGMAAPANQDVFAEFDITPVMRDALARDSKNLNVVLIPRGLFDTAGKPLPVPAQVAGSVGKVSIGQR